FAFNPTDRVRLLVDGNDRFVYGTSVTNCNDGGSTPEISQAAFLAALDNDLAGNDVMDVTYQPSGGTSCWVLQVVDDGASATPTP
ncbi:MAG: hypothetical protein ACI867_001343, partial [Glaciecola sp.]